VEAVEGKLASSAAGGAHTSFLKRSISSNFFMIMSIDSSSSTYPTR
jgi:hypothetical protein